MIEEYPNYEPPSYTSEPNELDILDGIYNAHNMPPVREHVIVESQHPSGDADWLLKRFLQQAYRRPVSQADHDRFLGLILKALDVGHSFTESMIAGYTAVLASPGYI